MTMQPLSTRAFEFGFNAAETSMAAAFTIAMRSPILFGNWGKPDVASAIEAQQMVAEKVEAAIESAGAANAALMLMWTKAAFGGLRKPSDVMHGLADVASAASQPVRRRVKANASRLAREATR
jgi:hypothetical protein